MVNAPATCSGSPVATYASISASVTSAKWTVVATSRLDLPPQGEVDEAVPGVQHAGAPAHPPPPPTASAASCGLAEDCAVERRARSRSRSPAVAARLRAGAATACALSRGQRHGERGGVGRR